MSSCTRSVITRRGFIKDASAVAACTAFTASIRPISPASAEAQENIRGWYKDIYRQLHIDQSFWYFKEVYSGFNAETAAQLIDGEGVQMVSYCAKSLYSHYPTKIGVPHPGLAGDYFGEFTRELKKRGIKCIAYFHLPSERKHQKEHPDWVVNRDPNVLTAEVASDRQPVGMCLNSPYVDKVAIPQMKEILALYDIDGFFFDAILQQYLSDNCYCKYCRELYKKEVGGEIPTDKNDPKAFAYRKFLNRKFEAVMEKYTRALFEVKPDIAILNNHCWISRYPVTPPPYIMHVCWDTPIPDYGLYSWNFSFEARYLATLVDVLPDITWSCMNVSSHGWVDFALRETDALMQECAIMLASCGRTYPSYNPYPSGNPSPAVMEALGKVNKRTSDLEPFVKNCKPVKDVVILHSADSVWSKEPLIPHIHWVPSPVYYPVCGAHKALIESHVQIGLANSEVFLKTIGEYNAIILPTQRILSDEESVAIRNFVRNGGALIATCETGTRDINNNRLKNFSISDVLGVEYQGTVETSISYLRVKSKIEQYGIPAYDIPVAGQYVRVKTTTAKTLLEIVPPYEGIKTGTPPPAELSHGPGVTINYCGKGKAIYCASGLFSAYYEKDTPVLRKLVLWLLGLIYPIESRTIVLENTPMIVEVFYNQRNSERFIHLINYSGDKRETGTPMVQDIPAVHGIRVRVRLRRKPESITSVPGGKKVAYEYQKGWVSFDAEPLYIHDIYRIEQ